MVTYCVRRSLMSATHLLTAAARTCRRSTPLCSGIHRHNSSTAPVAGEAFRLYNRSVVRIAGRDTVDLLQGLVTSDVTEMTDYNHEFSAQYSMMLNVQGRVLFDLILYNHTKVQEDVCLLVECDASLKEKFMKALKMYRIRKKVDISDASDDFEVWSVSSDVDPSVERGGDEAKTTGGKVNQVPNAVFCVPDPRVPLFGQRVLFRQGEGSLVNSDEDGEQYTSRRYAWGIPEGPTDLPPGNCLPLESNLTIMNGVSFLKGCYIGQELTARTHHTGVVRKRLVPLLFDSPSPDVESDAKVSTESGKNAGKVRGVSGGRGLGLLRLEHLGKPLSAVAKDDSALPLSAYKPGWWPQEIMK